MKFHLKEVDARWHHRQGARGELVLLDNRDSFVFNLAHRLEQLGHRAVVVRSDALSLRELVSWSPRALVLSPGPGHPLQAGISVEAVRALSGHVPILGVCLGHQAIGQAFGATVRPSGRPLHGVARPVHHDERGLFEGLPQGLPAARYHALIVEEPLPTALVPCAWSAGHLMGLRHRDHPTFGVQFHPESILSPHGLAMLERFLDLASSDDQGQRARHLEEPETAMPRS